MAQSDYDFAVEYGKGGKQPETCKSCGQPMQAPKPPQEQPSKFYQQRRTEDAGNYPRPKLGGMTVR